MLCYDSFAYWSCPHSNSTLVASLIRLKADGIEQYQIHLAHFHTQKIIPVNARRWINIILIYYVMLSKDGLKLKSPFIEWVHSSPMTPRLHLDPCELLQQFTLHKYIYLIRTPGEHLNVLSRWINIIQSICCGPSVRCWTKSIKRFVWL